MQVFILQRKLKNMLLLSALRKARRLRILEGYSSPKILELLEHVRSPRQFYHLFRVTLPVFMKLNEILFNEDPECVKGISEIQLLLFLLWLSSGLSYAKVAKFSGMATSTLETTFQNLFERFTQNAHKVIHFPRDKTTDLGKGMQELTSSSIFGIVVGCLDAFHVHIALSESEDIYLNDQECHSIQTQIVCDHRGVFMDLAVGFPGSMSKTEVLQCSPLYFEGTLPPSGYVLLSGSGYPCLQHPICLIPPISNVENPIHDRFNSCQESVHSMVRKSIGQMQRRWKEVFSKPNSIAVATHLVICCAMIHNICLDLNDIWPEAELVHFSRSENVDTLGPDQVGGESTQQQMAKLLLYEDEAQSIEDDYTVYEI